MQRQVGHNSNRIAHPLCALWHTTRNPAGAEEIAVAGLRLDARRTGERSGAAQRGSEGRPSAAIRRACSSAPTSRSCATHAARLDLKIHENTLEIGLLNFAQPTRSGWREHCAQPEIPCSLAQLRTGHPLARVFSAQPGQRPFKYEGQAPQ